MMTRWALIRGNSFLIEINKKSIKWNNHEHGFQQKTMIPLLMRKLTIMTERIFRKFKNKFWKHLSFWSNKKVYSRSDMYKSETYRECLYNYTVWVNWTKDLLWEKRYEAKMFVSEGFENNSKCFLKVTMKLRFLCSSKNVVTPHYQFFQWNSTRSSCKDQLLHFFRYLTVDTSRTARKIFLLFRMKTTHLISILVGWFFFSLHWIYSDIKCGVLQREKQRKGILFDWEFSFPLEEARFEPFKSRRWKIQAVNPILSRSICLDINLLQLRLEYLENFHSLVIRR